MCGIITIINSSDSSINDATIGAMLDTLSKRGPDDHDFIRFSNCVLGQTRLSIVDLAGGHQPMSDNSLPLTIVFNGEIYNYKELRVDLEKKGHQFSTASDTEVILKTYIEYGEDCPKYLDGMFAFSIWDEKAGKLFVARDRFGKKPLYYAFYGHTKSIIFASEIKAIFASNIIKGQIDWGAIDNYLTLMYVPPWKSVYKNIHVIPPAHSATYKNGELGKLNCYWSMPEKPETPSYEEAKIKIKELIKRSVKKRMVADVEIGSLLSGGIDSTLVTYLAQEFMDRPIKTFAVGYKGKTNELPYAKQASEKIGSNHHTLETKADLVNELEKVIAYMDEPHADTSNFPQHLISELAGSKVKVALSGDGADELFMGYGWYWKHRHLTFFKRMISKIFSNPFKGYIENISIFSKKERLALWIDRERGFVNSNILPKNISYTPNSIKKINRFDLGVYLPGQLLAKVDRTSMMHSLEVRSPFLDKDLAEYVYNIPTEYKMDGNQGKIILKDILAEIMPKEFVYRRKQGFGAPIQDWLKEEKIKSFFREAVDDKQNPLYEKISYKKVQKVFDEFYAKELRGSAQKVWTLACLALWFNLHKKYHE